jgi:hypothetical protein
VREHEVRLQRQHRFDQLNGLVMAARDDQRHSL